MTDHINLSTVKRLSFERPTLRFACGEHMIPYLEGIRNVDICEVGKVYDYGSFKISPFLLFHDVPNFGWRIFVKQPSGEYYKILRATDTCTLDGIEAKNYDLFAIESNYDEETVFEEIEQMKRNGIYNYRQDAINAHLSEQQARDFIFKNMKPESKIVRLHEHKIS